MLVSGDPSITDTLTNPCGVQAPSLEQDLDDQLEFNFYRNNLTQQCPNGLFPTNDLATVSLTGDVLDSTGAPIDGVITLL